MIKRESLKTLCRNQVNVISKCHSHKRRIFYIFALFVLILFLLIPLFFHHPRVESLPSKRAETEKNFHSALEANLEKLRQIEEPKPKEIRQLTIKPHHLPQFSKLYRLRQHAPTRMYVLGSSQLSNLSNNTTSTFLDKSNYASFANQSTQAPRAVAQQLPHPAYTIPQGEFVHAILETAIDSDLPGMIRAVISRPVYSYRGDRLLVPEGSRLIGQYSSQTLQGIHRVMVVWQRILLPNGVSIQIDSPGSDALGESGLGASSVDTHFVQRFGEASLLSLLGAASASLGIGSADSDNAAQRYRTAISHSFQSSASRALNHSVSIKPTLRIQQGAQVIVFVARDLDFYSVLGKARVD